MTTVGILGGGQLARMMALAGAPLGLRFRVLDNVADACAGQFAPMIVGDYTDQAALAQFAAQVDVATFDFENVPAESAQWLSERVPVFPNPRALAVAQDRLAEKTLFRTLGIPVFAFDDQTGLSGVEKILSLTIEVVGPDDTGRAANPSPILLNLAIGQGDVGVTPMQMASALKVAWFGRHAAELISVIALAVTANLKVTDIVESLLVHPALAEALAEAAD